jgi:hypothetical protein
LFLIENKNFIELGELDELGTKHGQTTLNLLNIWVFDKVGNLLGFLEKGRKKYGTKVTGCSLQDIIKSSLPG